MDLKMNIEVSALDDYPSVFDFLSSFQISKSRIKKNITAKKFLLKKVERKDVLSIPIDLFNHHIVCPTYQGERPKVICESECFFALSKPCKVHSLPLRYSEKDNLISFLRAGGKKYQTALEINKKSYEKGLLYRLDYETSGLILFAKDEKLFAHFRESNQKKKFYLALVHGGTEDAFSYAHHISYVGEKNSIGTVKASPFNNAHLEGKKIFYDQKENVSLILISLVEGMRHQIRVQMASSGHPIVGDPLYGPTTSVGNRMYLHAFCYQFEFNQREFSIVDENFEGLEVVFDRDRALKMAHDTLLRF